MHKKSDLLTTFKIIINKRRSLRKFQNKSINDKILKSILKSINTCPSSFGLEPWKVLVIKNQTIKNEIQKFCDNQQQVSTCSHLLIVLSYKSQMFYQNNPWMIKRIKEKRNLTSTKEYLEFYEERFMRYMRQIKDWNQWAIHQSYILLQTILLSATAHNLAASPMEGIDIYGIINFLEKNNLISAKEQGIFNCPYVVALGYVAENYQPKHKKINTFKETFTIIN